MAGIVFEITDKGLNEALAALDGLVDAPRAELAEGIGRLVQEQTRNRIENEKTSPTGEAWKANNAGTSILYQEGHLSRSIDYLTDENQVTIGSGLVYARIHQLGGKIIPKNAEALVFSIGGNMVSVKSVTMPARPYLGLSEQNRADILDAARDWLAGLIQ